MAFRVEVMEGNGVSWRRVAKFEGRDNVEPLVKYCRKYGIDLLSLAVNESLKEAGDEFAGMLLDFKNLFKKHKEKEENGYASPSDLEA